VGGHGPFRGLEAPQSAGFQYTVTIIAFSWCVREKLNVLTEAIIGAALEVHHELGPGLLENAYDACFGFELISRGLSIERQRALPVVYKGQRLDCGYRLDFVVEDTVIVEVKAVERLERVHSAQLLSYLRFARRPVGLLFNFNAGFLTRDGLKRVVNGSLE
jgi:GxxExxY protein